MACIALIVFVLSLVMLTVNVINNDTGWAVFWGVLAIGELILMLNGSEKKEREQ